MDQSFDAVPAAVSQVGLTPLAAADSRPAWLDTVGAFVIIALTAMFLIVTIGPYFGLQPATDDANQKAVVNNLFIAVVAFFIGGSVASRKKDDNIGTLTDTVSKAQAIISPEPKADVKLDPGQTASVTAKEKTK
jgi:hypothetical protein